MNLQENADGFARVSMVLVLMSTLSLMFPIVTPSLGLAAAVCGFLGRKSELYRARAIVSCVFGVVSLVLGMAMIFTMAAIGPYMKDIGDVLLPYIK